MVLGIIRSIYFGGYDMKSNEINVLMVAPGEHPREASIGNDLDSLQQAVSVGCDYQGLIEIVGLEDGVCILCNEEAKLIGLEGNRRLGNDIITGVFYVVGENGRGDLISLTDKQMEKYRKRFWDPEYFTPAEISRLLYVFLNAGW
jgi:hypothetical protein